MNTKIILDFETSGLNPYHDDIIEVAMKLSDSSDNFESLIKPKSNEPISQQITNITGITNRMLAENGHEWQEVYESMNAWLWTIYNFSENNKITIISHNGKTFDFIFLKRIFSELNNLGIKTIPIKNIIFVDSLLLAKRLIPGRYSYKQSALCQTYNIQCEGSHRALNDIIALEKLYKKLCDILNIELNKRRDPYNNPDMILDYIKCRI
tara:strand:+ start:1798 stop:2424 length:627 start_codon:yes stop_codon:yes gene_type:complete